VRSGVMPAACQPIVPVLSTHTMFSEGMRLNVQASTNSAHVFAWFMRRLERYGAPPCSIQPALRA
jgi:hypothetical protein